MVIVVLPGALLDGAFSCANILAPGAPGGDERMCDYLPPSAAELLVSLARESEQLKIKIGQLEKDNAALKAELSELKKSLDAQEAQ